MKTTKIEEIEYFIFTNPTDTFWKWDRALVYKKWKEWYGYWKWNNYNDLYRDEIIPNNIRLATEEEIEYCKRNDWNLYWYLTEQDKKNQIDETERKEKELLKKLLKKYPDFNNL